MLNQSHYFRKQWARFVSLLGLSARSTNVVQDEVGVPAYTQWRFEAGTEDGYYRVLAAHDGEPISAISRYDYATVLQKPGEDGLDEWCFRSADGNLVIMNSSGKAMTVTLGLSGKFVGIRVETLKDEVQVPRSNSGRSPPHQPRIVQHFRSMSLSA